MKKFLLLLGVALISSGMLMAQQTVTGRVTDAEDGSALPGVNILEKGTTNGTVTDIDGNYTLRVSGDAVLVFSFVGYLAQETAVGGRTSIDVQMAPDVTQLSEVVVVGYGTQEKKEITSAVASVGAEDFNTGNVTDPAQLIQGKVAGLSITRAGGNPNSGFNVRLRGLSTFGANTSPLVVIDGVIGASLDNLDPNDIATIDVLKDGSAAAIYGARGSAGVILVTTKSGKGAGETSFVDFTGYVTVDNVANTIDILSAEQYLAEGGTDFGGSTDWIDELTRTGVSYTGNLAFGGSSSSNSSYRASINYRNNEGVAVNTGFERINTRLQLNQNALDGKLRLSVNASYNERNDQNINNEAFRYAIIYNPTAPIFEDEANAGRIQDYGPYFQRDLFDFYNPVALVNQQDFSGDRTNILLNGRVEYDLLPNLTLAVNYGQDRLRGVNNAYWSKQDFASGFGSGGRARKQQYASFNEILTGTAQFNTELIDKLDFTALVGAETQIRKDDGFAVMARNFLFDFQGADNLSFSSIRDGGNTELFSYRNKNTLNSAFARLNFNYDNTFFLSASLRGESWSGFGENEKTGYFPAVSIGSELTNLFDLGPVSTLKLRASYGVTGQLPPAADLALPVWGPGGRVDLDEDPDTNGDLFVVPQQQRDPNPGLKWEVKKEINVGVDFGLFDDRWTGSIDWYTRNISDLLYGLNISAGAANPFEPGESAVVGFAWANIGELTAGGLEFATSYNGVRLGPVSWTPSFNMTWYYQKTKIESLQLTEDIGIPELRLGNLGSPGQNNTVPIRNIPGELVGDIYGPRYLGVDENGQYVLSADINDPDNHEKLGNGLPNFELGFANTFNWGKWDLNFFLRGVFGHDLINSYRNFYESRQDNKTWNFVNTDKADPRIVATPTFSSLYVEDASFLRLDNAQIGYNFGVGSSAFSKIRLYVAGQNLFTITNYSGIDPEFRPTDTENGDGFQTNLAPGIERRGTYFTVRSFTFGVVASLK
ncbi:SusC/RagA family TonB-linked outer membrane protein [Fulvivirga sedimenti]|uniref:SusC/RagA family TonB-linked outer membrane protein n=1 Tax=Fulvivirga sedimenti TaxID=2879465 RepID=A0A9X1HZ99_9BACT|nr:SusC/RagA family TonB-linked outer membrane protein [Fulvivirga sedimenti]MCA6079184.1 SusC/RagA family TonB-linked outer membrane protein [Fulvivirga sedimenti]